MNDAKKLCIYHGNCADGFGAAWVVRKALGSDVEFHAAHYGGTPPDVAGKHVIIVDFSYPKEILSAMATVATSILVLDHHKTAQADLHDFPAAEQCCYHPIELAEGIRVLFDMNRSGAGIAWDYFFPGQPRPALINHIEDRDLWLYKLDGTREIISGLFSYPHDFNVWDKLLEQDRRALRALRDDGHAIDRKQRKDVAELVAATKRRLVIGGFDVPVANLPFTFASDAGALMSAGEPFSACYWDTAEGRSFSLRSSVAGEDVSAVAKQYGGGGHRNASGFKVPFGHELTLTKLKCYQVGDYDLVAAHTPNQAIEILETFGGYEQGDLCLHDVEEATDEFLDSPCHDEEGNPSDPWRAAFNELTAPGYIGGWE